MPVHPDPDKETILLRYPEDGSVKAVSNLIQDNKGNQEIVTTDPTTKNQPAFYQKRDSLFIANFLQKHAGPDAGSCQNARTVYRFVRQGRCCSCRPS